MDYITLLDCIVSLIVIAIAIYLIVDLYKQDVRYRNSNDRLEEDIKEFEFKNNLRGQKWG